MDAEEIGDIIEYKEKITPERIDRDRFYLITTRASIMKELALDSTEWIVEEIKEQLEMISLIKKLDNNVLISYAKTYEKRIREINKDYGTILKPIIQLGKRRKASVDIQQYAKTIQHVQNCYEIILELLRIRMSLDSLARTDESRADLCPEPNMSSEKIPAGIYS